MNPRLLTAAEKEQNRRGRESRKSQRRALLRRQALLAELAALDGTGLAGQLFSPRDSVNLLTAHLACAKVVADRMGRTMRLARMGQSDGPPTNIQAAPPRPMRMLRERNCGKVWPALLANAIDVVPPMTLTEAMAATKRHADAGASPHALLDFCVRASGLPWETAGQILHERRLIPAAFSPTDILAIRRAREFWDRYQEGRTAYAMAVAAHEIPAMYGGWALFESEQLADLLRGFHMPRLLQRSAYVTNLIQDRMGLTLDIHAFPSLLPLARHSL